MALVTTHAIFTSFLTSSMLTLASLSRVPIFTSTTGTVKCCFFLGDAHPLQGHSGVFPKIDFKKSTSVLCLQASGVELLFGIKRFPKSKFLGLQVSTFARSIHCKILRSQDSWIAILYDREIWLDSSIARFVDREICPSRDSSITKNKIP